MSARRRFAVADVSTDLFADGLTESRLRDIALDTDRDSTW
jgi:hypothetical protein